MGGGLDEQSEEALPDIRERRKGKHIFWGPPARWSVKVHLAKHGVGAPDPVSVALHSFSASGHWDFPPVLNEAYGLLIPTDDGTSPEDLVVVGEVVQ